MTAATASLPADDTAAAIIVRAQEPESALTAFRDRRCVVKETDSGWLETLFGSVHLSGSHRQSVEMVAGYEADVAAIDGSALAHLRRLYPALLEKVRVLCWTPA